MIPPVTLFFILLKSDVWAGDKGTKCSVDDDSNSRTDKCLLCARSTFIRNLFTIHYCAVRSGLISSHFMDGEMKHREVR